MSDPQYPDPAWRRRLRSRMLRWFDAHARQMPWRPSPGLYETWVSEIMLQQTQVATVVPYYERFLKRFPSVEALAGASQEEVLRQWEGLGYYRRARQLHAAAQQIVNQHNGEFPRTIELVRDLPGIGRYTAGAILSIALDQRHPILEANTIRVLSRLLPLSSDPHSPAGQKILWQFAELVLPRRRVGDLNQSLMELGSTLCVPRQPACHECPIAPLCPTRESGLQDQIPQPKSKAKSIAVRESAVVVQAADKLLLRRCQPGERWEGLWDFPRFAVTQDSQKKLKAELVQSVAELTGLSITLHNSLATIQHSVTRYRITLTCHLATCDKPGRNTEKLKWVTHAAAHEYPLSVTGRKIWKLLAAQA